MSELATSTELDDAVSISANGAGAPEVVIRVETVPATAAHRSSLPADPGARASGSAGHLIDKGTDFVKAFAGPISVTTVVLYYFGWVRSNAIASHWGYTTDMIGLSNEDFLLRSVIPLYRPVGFGVLILLFAQRLSAGAKTWIAEYPDRAGRLLGPARAAPVLGGGLLLLAAVRLDEIEAESNRDAWYVTAFLIIGGAVVIGTGLWVRAAIERASEPGFAPSDQLPPRLLSLSTFTPLLAVALLGLFILVSQMASRVGSDQALRTEAALPFRAAVTLFSEERLYISAEGVSEVELPSEESNYRWRYQGLRLFAQGNGQLILLPGSYGEGNAKAFVVPLGDGVRLDLDRSGTR